MQDAAFLLNVRNTAMVVAVTVGCAAMDISRSGLAFERVHGVVEHHRHDAGNVGEQEEPE